MENTENKNLELEQKISEASELIKKLKNEVHKKIVWQEDLIDSLIIWVLAKWHVLLEWLPWLAKTLTVSTLSQAFDLWFNRIQFTPDLLPSDLIWTEIYNINTWEFSVKKWPVFNNFILADEINRAPSKVQSALLEAMEEKQVTIWKETFKLDEPFIVLATQNPLEQSWVYNLPEAQKDRFLLKVDVFYPWKKEELEVYKMANLDENVKIEKIINKKKILEIQKILKEIHISENIFNYVSDLVDASRNPENFWMEDLKKYISYWVSPRWWLALLKSAKVVALINWRSFVIPEDVQKMAISAMNHRIELNYEAVADDVKSEEIIRKILENVKFS